MPSTVTQHFYNGRAASDTSPPDFQSARQCWEEGVNYGCMPSAVELGCLLFRGAPGIPANVAHANELFNRVQLSHDDDAQLHLSQRLQHGTHGIPIDFQRASALLERAAELGWTNIPPVLQGRMILHSGIGHISATSVQQATKLFSKAAGEDGWLGCAELGLLYQYGGVTGVLRYGQAAKTQFERMEGLRVVADDYQNDDGDDYPDERVYELYYGNLLAFGADGVEHNPAKAEAVLRASARLFPQAAVLLAFISEHDHVQNVRREGTTAISTRLYAQSAPLLWNHVFRYTNDVHRTPAPGRSSFIWNILCNVFANYNYAGYEIETLLSHHSGPWPTDVTEALCKRVDIITLFCIALLLERGASPFPKDVRGAKTLFQHAADLGHGGAKEKLLQLPNTRTTSPLVQMFAQAVEEPDVLTEDFLARAIREEHVTFATALIAGHNLVLLAIRAGVLRGTTIEGASNIVNSWYIRDHLYHPASKLIDEDPAILTSIFQHAEKLGIIVDGYVFKVGLSIRRDERTTTQSIVNVLGELARDISTIRHCLRTVHYNRYHSDNDAAPLHNHEYHNKDQQGLTSQAVHALSESLSDLQDRADHKDRKYFHTNLVKVILSLAGLNALGALLGNGANVINEEPHKLPVLGEEPLRLIETIAKVDLSNVRILRSIFSDKSISQLDQGAKSSIQQAVGQSRFAHLKSLQRALNYEVTRNAQHSPVSNLIDLGENPWNVPPLPCPGPSPCTGQNVEQSTAIHFRSLIREDTVEHEDGHIDPPVALVEINKLLTKAGLKNVSEDRFDDFFFDTMNGEDTIDTVDESHFIRIYLHFHTEFQREANLAALKTECETYVGRKFHATGEQKLKSAAHYLRALYKRKVKSGTLTSINACDESEDPFEAALRAQQCQGETISKTVFVEAFVNLSRDHLR